MTELVLLICLAGRVSSKADAFWEMEKLRSAPSGEGKAAEGAFTGMPSIRILPSAGPALQFALVIFP